LLATPWLYQKYLAVVRGAIMLEFSDVSVKYLHRQDIQHVSTV
jgi:hypothetical protein